MQLLAYNINNISYNVNIILLQIAYYSGFLYESSASDNVDGILHKQVERKIGNFLQKRRGEKNGTSEVFYMYRPEILLCLR